MKKFFVLLLSIIIVMVVASSINAAEPYTIYLKNKPLEITPYYNKGVFYLPVQKAAEVFKVKISWDEADKLVIVNGKKTAFKLQNFKSGNYVPLEDLCEVLNFDIKIYDNSKSIVISSKAGRFISRVYVPDTMTPDEYISVLKSSVEEIISGFHTITLVYQAMRAGKKSLTDSLNEIDEVTASFKGLYQRLDLYVPSDKYKSIHYAFLVGFREIIFGLDKFVYGMRSNNENEAKEGLFILKTGIDKVKAVIK